MLLAHETKNCCFQLREMREEGNFHTVFSFRLYIFLFSPTVIQTNKLYRKSFQIAKGKNGTSFSLLFHFAFVNKCVRNLEDTDVAEEEEEYIFIIYE